MVKVLGEIRRKYLSFIPRPREVVDEDGVVISSHDENGREVLDPTPIDPPIGFTNEPSMMDVVRNMVSNELMRRELEEAGLETFEESEDFDTGDDDDMPRMTRHEINALDEFALRSALGHGAEAPSGDPDPDPTPEPKAPSKAPKKASTTPEGDDQ